jgi:hypothetical protein
LKVLWSWQSDTPGAIGRFFVRDALKAAIEELKVASDIDEPTRNALHLDYDREGVPGSPELARTILDKIDVSDVVIADVTLVASMSEGDTPESSKSKMLINSNVAIEFGYALRALSFRKVLMVFNAHYGRHEDLPFDIRHRGGAIVFTLAPGSGREERDQERKTLIAKFVSALRLCLPNPIPSPSSFPETANVDSAATYFPVGEVLAQIGEPDIAHSYEPTRSANSIGQARSSGRTRPSS